MRISKESEKHYNLSHSEEILGIRKKLEETFLSFYKKHGYSWVSPIPLIPGEIDPSVTFTGATVNGWKRYLTGENKLPNRGIYTAQPCLRTQNATSIYDFETTPKFGSYFSMAGVLSPAGRLPDIYHEALSLLTEELGVAKKDIVVHIASDHEEISTCAREGPYEIKIETDQIGYYKWNYGIEGVLGEGLTIALLNKRSQEFEEIGNIVLIKNSGKAIATEWGFGLETTTSRLLSLPHPVFASPVIRFIEKDVLSTPLGVRLGDSLVAISALLANGTDLNSSNQKVTRVLEKYKRGIAYLAALEEIPGTTVVEIITKIVSSLSPEVRVSPETIEQLVRYFSNAGKRQNDFLNSVRGILTNPVYRTNPERAAKSLQRTAKNYGFHNLKVIRGIISFNARLFTKEDLNFLKCLQN